MFLAAPTPGVEYMAIVCDDVEEWDRIAGHERWLFNDQPAVLDLVASDRLTRWLRFNLDAPFRMPPTVIRFEDEDVADRIAATGWYSMEGRLYRAELREPGVLVLDQVYAVDPSPVYEGRVLPSEVSVVPVSPCG